MPPEEVVEEVVPIVGEVVADEAIDDAAAELEFAAGFDGTEVVKDDAAPAEAVVVEEPVVAEVPTVVESKPLTTTDQQFLDLVKKAQSIDEVNVLLAKMRDHTNGRIGSIEHTLKSIQESTASGSPIEVTDEDFAELLKDLPDIAPNVIAGVKRVMGKVKGRASVVVETPEQFEARVNTVADQRIALALKKQSEKLAMDTLTKQHADWNTVIGPKDSQTEFRTWLSTQPHTYAETFLDSWDPAVVAEGLSKFKASKVKAEPPKPSGKAETAAARAQRLLEAVPARGGSAAPAKAGKKTDEEEFEEGFKS